jgi:hypothetical protein
MTKFVPTTAFTSASPKKAEPISLGIIDGAIDHQSQWAIVADDGEIITRGKLMRVGFIWIRQRPDGKVIAIAPGKKELIIPYPARASDKRGPSDEAWRLMGIEVSEECTRWVRSFLGGEEYRLVEIDQAVLDEDDFEEGDDLAFFGESDFPADKRWPQHGDFSPKVEEAFA